MNLMRTHDAMIGATIDNLQQVDAAIAATRLTARTNGTLWDFARRVIWMTSTAPRGPTIDNLRQINAALATNSLGASPKNTWGTP
jgi:hypothetical protein